MGRKGKTPKRFNFCNQFGGQAFQIRTYMVAYECDCGWRCQRDVHEWRRRFEYRDFAIIDCPVCCAPKEMMAVAGYFA